MKIAFLDIDGTLIDVPGDLLSPTPATISTLQTFQKNGNKIVIATARGNIPDCLKPIGFDGWICNDGHYIFLDHQVLLEDTFSLSQLEKMEAAFQRYNGRPSYSRAETQWCACADDPLIVRHREMFAGTKEKPSSLKEHYSLKEVHAIACCVLFETREQLLACYRELQDDFTMVPYETGLIRMDVYCKGFTKGTACRYVYEQLHIPFENTYAFGDGINDREMLENVKYGTAMGNAVKELKDIAYLVTDTVQNEGITRAFQTYFP